MLFLTNDFLGKDATLIFDRSNGNCFLLILKNGTTSFHSLVNSNPNRFFLHSGSQSDVFVKKHNITEITVFVRDPIERFLSAIGTHHVLHNMPRDHLVRWINKKASPVFVDGHTTPQFWFMLRVNNCCPQIKFKIRPFTELSLVDGITHEHKTLESNSVRLDELTIEVQQKINFLYTEDVVLYNKFINSTVTIDDIVKEIKLENNFINKLKSYSWYNDMLLK